MNINDLREGAFKVISQPTNINQLQPGAFTKINEPIQPSIGPAKAGVLQSIKTGLGKRAENLGQIADRFGSGKQNLASSAFQTGVEGLSGLWDIIGSIAQPVIDPLLSVPLIGGESVKQSISGLTQQPLIGGESLKQSVEPSIDRYKVWRENNPELAYNIEALVKLAASAPIGSLAKTGTGTLTKGIGQLGDALESSAIKSVARENQSFIRDLVRPAQTKAVKEAQVSRTIETGVGPFKKSEIIPTPAELRIEDAVSKVAGLDKSKTLQQNYNLIRDAQNNVGKELEDTLKGSGGTWSQSNLVGKIREAEVPIAVKNIEGTKQVADIESYITQLSNKVSKDAAGAYELSKNFRSNISKVYGENIWIKDTPIANYIKDVNRKLNDFVESVLPEGKTAAGISYKEAQAQRTGLINAMDNIAPKAAIEADTAIGRAMQRVSVALGTKNRAVQAVAAAAGIGGLGAAATFAPGVAAVGIPAYLLYKGGKLLLKPQVRSAAAKILKEIEKGLLNATKPIEIKKLSEADKALRSAIGDWIDNPKIGLQLEDVSKKANPTVGKTVDLATESSTVSIDRFAGKDADIFPSQTTVAKSSVDYWKRQISKGERPLVEVEFSNRTNKFQVVDGHARLRAYKDLGIKNIPIKGDVSKGLGSLAQEARKYKTAEDRIVGEAIKKHLESNGIKVNPDNTVTLYHATSPENIAKINKEGIIKGGSTATGGMTGLDLKPSAFFGTDMKWTKDTWGASGRVIEVKVPVQDIRQPSQNIKEVYFEGGLKKGSDGIWRPLVKPRSTFYDKLLVKGRKL